MHNVKCFKATNRQSHWHMNMMLDLYIKNNLHSTRYSNYSSWITSVTRRRNHLQLCMRLTWYLTSTMPLSLLYFLSQSMTLLVGSQMRGQAVMVCSCIRKQAFSSIREVVGRPSNLSCITSTWYHKHNGATYFFIYFKGIFLPETKIWTFAKGRGSHFLWCLHL